MMREAAVCAIDMGWVEKVNVGEFARQNRTNLAHFAQAMELCVPALEKWYSQYSYPVSILARHTFSAAS